LKTSTETRHVGGLVISKRGGGRKKRREGIELGRKPSKNSHVWKELTKKTSTRTVYAGRCGTWGGNRGGPPLNINHTTGPIPVKNRPETEEGRGTPSFITKHKLSFRGTFDDRSCGRLGGSESSTETHPSGTTEGAITVSGRLS